MTKKESKINEVYLSKKIARLKEAKNTTPQKYKYIGNEVENKSERFKMNFEEEEKKLLFSDDKGPKKAKTIHIENHEENPPMSTTEFINKFYRVGKILGKGAFGKVNLAIDRKLNELVAIKSINKHYLSNLSTKSKVALEVSILERINHQNIVCMQNHFETDNHVIFVMELAAGGDLLNYVRKRRKLSENTAKVIFKQILKGLEHCHANNVLHRDIKLDNILLDSRGEVKIGDFGVSKIVKDGEIMREQ